MKKCKSCEFENKDDARFCVKCGAALDKRCSGCDNILDEDEVYCPVCGARTDGKRVCPSCRALNKPQSVFCSTCGTPLVRIQPPANKAATKAAHVPPPPVAAMQNGVPMAAPKEKGYAKQAALRILNIVRASAVLAFALLMFIMSFFSVQKIEAPDLGDDLNLGGITEIVEVNVTPIDIIEGSFARLDPKTQTEVAKDFMKYLLNDLSDREKKIINGVINGSSSANYMEALDLIKSKLESYNVLKFAAVEEVTEFTPSTTFNLWLSSAYALLYIGVAAAFLVLAILDFINTLRKKENRFKPLMTLNALGAAAALGYAFLLKMLFEGSMGFGLTSVLVFALLSMLLNIGYRIFAGDIHFEKAKLPLYISTGVGAVFSLLMLFFAGSSVMRLFCEYTSGSMSKSFRGGYGAFDLAGAWDALKISADDPTILGSAAKYIPQAFMSYNGELLRIALSPSMMGILGGYADRSRPHRSRHPHQPDLRSVRRYACPLFRRPYSGDRKRTECQARLRNPQRLFCGGSAGAYDRLCSARQQDDGSIRKHRIHRQRFGASYRRRRHFRHRLGAENRLQVALEQENARPGARADRKSGILSKRKK